MSAGNLASRYAKALIEEATSKGIFEDVNKDVQIIANTFAISPELKAVIHNPIISSEKKTNILHALFADKVSETTMSFIHLLLSKRREGSLADITVSFNTQYNIIKEITEIKITTAVQMDQEVLRKIAEKVKHDLKLKNVRVNVEVKPEILGGFIVDIGDKLYDASVFYKLSKMKKELIYN